MSQVQGILPTFDDPMLVVAPEPLVCFELPGVPGYKARVRVRIVFPKFSKRPFPQFHPDSKTAAYEKRLKAAAMLEMAGRKPTAEPVCLLVHAFKPVPESWSKRDREAALAGAILPTSKPDGDNYLKIVDALNSVIWVDDSQVVDARIIKRYSDEPALRIEVREFVRR